MAKIKANATQWKRAQDRLQRLLEDAQSIVTARDSSIDLSPSLRKISTRPATADRELKPGGIDIQITLAFEGAHGFTVVYHLYDYRYAEVVTQNGESFLEPVSHPRERYCRLAIANSRTIASDISRLLWKY